MSKCKGCKWWKEYASGWGECKKNMESCRCDIVGVRPWVRAKKRDYVFCSNFGSWGKEMNVIFGGDFGCIHFEKKKEEG